MALLANSDRLQRIATGLFVVDISLTLAGIVLMIGFDVNIPIEVGGIKIVWPLSSIVYNFLALLIISRHPRHIVGWLFFLVGVFLAYTVSIYFGYRIFEQRIDNRLAITMISFFGELGWIVALFVPVTLVLQFFPDGRLPSRRWWPVTLLSVLAIFILFAEYIPGIFGFTVDINLNESWRLLLEIVLGIPGAVGSLGSLAAVVVRYRRSKGYERTQMKWLVYTAVTGILLGAVLLILFGVYEVITSIYITSLPTILALAIGIAIIRHRLFDIDIIIRRTLQYAILTGILAFIYFGSVVTLQGIFSAAGGQESPIFIVISTLVIAGLFSPLRRRIQDVIDRRFYRSKYEAEQALAQFAAAARDEVDLDHLSTALLAVVQDTIQPEHLSLWLARTEKELSI